jgi:hypothetical protein
MGYRNYLGSLPKKEYNKIKNFTLQELYAHKGEKWDEDLSDGYVGVYDVAYNCHYELGKYVDQFPDKYFKPVFKNKETQKHFIQEHDFYIVDQEFVKAVIDNYTEKIRKYYNDMLNELFDGSKVKAGFMIDKNNKPTDAEMKTVFAIVDHVRSMAIEWGVAGWLPDEVPYSLDPKRDLVSSWKYEYSIFNLVNLYKTFDWKRNVMIYYGY